MILILQKRLLNYAYWVAISVLYTRLGSSGPSNLNSYPYFIKKRPPPIEQPHGFGSVISKFI